MAAKAFKCNTCGKTYTAKTKIGHATMFGHKSFSPVKKVKKRK